jgi:ABC-type transport system involved in multi-copper enzyme maturation permease subunit
LLLGAAIFLSVIPSQGTPGALFLPYGFLCLPLALLFLMAFARSETEAVWRWSAVGAVGATGLVLALTSFIGSNVSPKFLLPYGLLLGLVGLAYWWAFVSMQGSDSEWGYRSGLAMGAAGVIVFLTALGRSVIPVLLQRWGWMERRAEEPYIASAGLLLMTLGLLYAAVSAGLCSDNRLIVLTRRELAAFFYSPIAYIVLFALTFIGFRHFYVFVNNILSFAERGAPLFEPIIQYYFVDFIPVFSVLIVAPVLTMRLLSEERRTGTLEVLLTAPLGETSIVLSKFLAAWIFFMLLWVPWGLYLVALRVEGGQPFDYRPLLSFSIAMACSGAGFVAMGTFFSSITRNQIIAAILGIIGMIVLFSVFIVIRSLPPGSDWSAVLTHMSFVHLWINTLEGKLAPRDLLFHLSAAVFWLFLTVKVLEARKWA